MDVQIKRDNRKAIQNYHGYLLRLQRKDHRSLYELHRLVLCQEVARDYGMTVSQIKRQARLYRRMQRRE